MRAGMAAAALGLAGWGNAAAPWHLAPAALPMACNGAGAGGIVFAPLWVAPIAAWGFGPASVAVALAFPDGGPALLMAGAVLFGLGIGNLLSLPPLIAQRDWPPAEVARVVAW